MAPLIMRTVRVNFASHKRIKLISGSLLVAVAILVVCYCFPSRVVVVVSVLAALLVYSR